MNKKYGISSGTLMVVLLSGSLLIGCKSGGNKASKEDVAVNTPNVNAVVKDVKINDSFWSPRLKLWSDVTVNDVFNKFTGQYSVVPETGYRSLITEYQKLGRTRNVMLNYDNVTQGKRGIDQFNGTPAMEGFFWMAVRGASDLLFQFPNNNIEERIDGFVGHIEAAQNKGGDGYISTYTMLVDPEHQFGYGAVVVPASQRPSVSNQRGPTTGANAIVPESRQRSISNQGRMTEGAIHYYMATGKTKFLNIAVKSINHMSKEIGLPPKKNIEMSHAGAEEVIMKLYLLFKDDPDLRDKMSERVNEKDYYDLAKFFVEDRGYHYDRPSWGKNSQDSASVFKMKTIEGHAVKATLLGTGITAIAIESMDPRYIKTANSWWDNMVGKRMYITGGVGAVASGERFGPDYFLPNNGYAETCAGGGSGFFSHRMAQLYGDGKYIDELERVLYNVMLGAVSLSGNHYNYQNPLVGDGFKRWDWHSTPCCPPSFLKTFGELPKYIYSQESNSIYVNLFIGSKAKIKLDDSQDVIVKQTTNYPWEGRISINIEPSIEKEFTVKVRIPGWAQSIENPYGLYNSKVKSKASIKVNGRNTALKITKGYVNITRNWAKGDVIELNLPMEPRFVYANEKVENLKGMVALASGPIVYGFEEFDNPELNSYKIDINSSVNMTYKNDVLNGVNIITGKALTDKGTNVDFTAVPYSTLNNRTPGNVFKVWMPVPVKE